MCKITGIIHSHKYKSTYKFVSLLGLGPVMKNLINANYKDIFGDQFVELCLDPNVQAKVLITGAKGMLGHALALAVKEIQNKIPESGLELILCSRNWNFWELRYWRQFRNIKNVTNLDLTNRFKSVDYVIHAASPSNMTKIDSINDLRYANVDLLKEVLKLDPKKIMFVSTGEVYGGGSTFEGKVATTFSCDRVRDWYPLVKLEAEATLQDFGKIHTNQIMVIRLFHTYGPGLKTNDGRSFSDILWGAALKKEISLKSRGTQIRSFLYISDAVIGMLKVLFTTSTDKIILNVGSETPLTILQFAEKVAALTGSTISIKEDPDYIHSPNDVILPDLTLIKGYNWQPKIGVDEGILRTINWMNKSQN